MMTVFLAAFREVPPPGWEEGLLYNIWQDRGLLWNLWLNLIHANRFNMILDGLLLTLQIAGAGVLIGTF